jgi:hypothetical protein
VSAQAHRSWGERDDRDRCDAERAPAYLEASKPDLVDRIEVEVEVGLIGWIAHNVYPLFNSP